MKVKIPREIKIGSYKYKIRPKEDMSEEFHVYGMCSARRGMIWVDMIEDRQVKEVTLLHEFVHCIGDVERIEFEEGDIDRIAHCLVRILRDDFGIEFDWSQIK